MPAFRVPASTTNLGHGFDCLGMALGLYNTITVTAGGDSVTAPDSADPGLVVLGTRMRDACARAWGCSLPGFSVQVRGDVPIARGLGSSSTILLGVAAACQTFAGRTFDRHELIELAAEVEGHPDNVAAACLGGFTIVGRVGGRLRTARFPVPNGLMAVVTIPPYEVKTSEARAILPQQLSRTEHVTGIQRTALIVAALANGDPEALRGLFDEAWHEGYRATLNPELAAIRRAAEAAGALATMLSGSGSTVVSFAATECAEVVRAGISSSSCAAVRILPADGKGLITTPGQRDARRSSPARRISSR